MALLKNREPRVDHKLVKAAIRSRPVTVRDVMKPHADIHGAFLRRKNANAAARFTDKRELARVFDRHRLIEPKQTAVHMHKRMHLRAVRKIELQAERRDTAAVSRFAI